MSVRLVLAAVVTIALLAGSIPAIEEANRARAAGDLADSTDRLSHAITAIHRQSDPVPLGVPGARRQVSLDLPDGGTEATIRVDPSGVGQNGSSPSGTISYQVADGQTHRQPVGAAIRVLQSDGTVAASDTSLTVRSDEVLTLGYHVIDGTPTVTVTRGFIPEDRTNPSHVGSAG